MTSVDEYNQPLSRALISTADKAGLVEFASQLIRFEIEIIATASTAKFLAQHKIPAVEVNEYTGFPEILGGRVKTLHPKIYGGLLKTHKHALPAHLAIPSINLVVVNLYPFKSIVADSSTPFDTVLEHIDIGGVSLLRAAAKNFQSVTAIFDPNDYSTVLSELEAHQGKTQLATRYRLAHKAFAHVASYDMAIANYFSKKSTPLLPNVFPEELNLTFHKKVDLRYGENPHQQACLYIEAIDGQEQPAPMPFTPLQGRSLSFNNFLDSDCAYRCVTEFPDNNPTCAIVKHANPCGVAQADTQLEAYQNAYQTDPQSAFGSIVAFNSPLEAETAKKMVDQHFIEIVIAPDFSLKAREILHGKPDIRVLGYDPTQLSSQLLYQSIAAGLLVQTPNNSLLDPKKLQRVSVREPTVNEMIDLLFAWQVVKYVKSNAVVCAKNRSTVCIGGGQPSRVFALKIALLKAKEVGLCSQGTVLASDAFFPFADNIELAAKAGITAIIQPGGSKRDPEVITAANKANIAMLFTNQRHFRH